MTTKMTRDVMESYLHCKYKGHLKLTGQQGTKSDYETLLTEMRAEVRLAAIEKILACHAKIPRNITLTTSALKQGASYLLDVTLEDDLVCLTFDGLKKMDGPSKLGDFHYVPMLFHEGNKVRKEQRLLLELYGLLLSRLQGQMPAHGIIWHGKECHATRVRLNADLRKTERLLRDLKEMCTSESLPKLILNDHCQVCEFRQRCHAQAAQEDNLSLLRGLGEKEIKRYRKKGIFTVTQLAHTFRPRRKGKRQMQRTPQRYYALQALAIRDKKVYIFGRPELPASPVRIYLDMEGDPDQGYVYLIGMIVVHGDTEVTHSFWADSKEQEVNIFEQFLAEVAKYGDFVVFCYGSYERAFLRRMRKAAKAVELVDKMLDVLVNTLSLIYAHIYFSTYSNGLKDVGGSLGCSWTDTDASGIQSVFWRKRWAATKGEDWKQKLLTYNMEDCAALKRVTEFIAAIASTGALTGETTGHLPASNASILQPYSSRPDWGTPAFSNDDFEFINKCSHFDYQRNKVYVRTNTSLMKLRAKAQRRLKRLKASHYIDIICTRCPYCDSTDVASLPKRRYRRVSLDLRITATAVRRVVKGVETSRYRCTQCDREFFPEQYVNRAKYGHSLKSWAMYEHVAHRASFENLEETFRELFRLPVCFRHIHVFKTIMASYYKETYDGILRKLKAGLILHADETEVHLKKIGKGYVWVFTNLEEVLYVFKPTREGAFLKQMFAGFSGVLISDFYAAYDSVECLQQKCLIHLMRDLNDDLLSNPFDVELMAMTAEFGQLLRRVIATVDHYGLKQRHLKKHQKEVDRYFRVLARTPFSSEPAQATQKRMVRYQDKLFAFLKYDGVPWNNNNAEHAIKRFAYYRAITDGKMTEAGLADYLLLLSIFQTCKRKGISFLDFLLSREVDLDSYSGCRPPLQKKAEIETCPLERGFFEKGLRQRRSQVLQAFPSD